MSKAVIKRGERGVWVQNGLTKRKDFVSGPYDIKRDGKLYYRMNGVEGYIPEDEIFFKPSWCS
jgi:hypothetical protein